MALQFLYSTWLENDIETTLKLASDGVLTSDIEYILHTVGITDKFDETPSDEENEELTNTLYLKLPSSSYALIRTGWYSTESAPKEKCSIVHAFIQEENEEISPMLYAINNCFRHALTDEERTQLLTQSTLPTTPFPRPQFKLSQAEIRKFFSQGRLRTLACLLQAVIDSHGNHRMIVLKDSYPSLKYWFYGIHSCLPKSSTKCLTYTTYAFNKPDDCVLICSAPTHSIDLETFADEGNFVIDNLDDIGCGDIESANFSNLIVRDFVKDVRTLPALLDGIETQMSAYKVNVSTAAGIFKLKEFDFEWFNSAHDIHYFLGKIGAIDKDSLAMISHKLWEAFLSTDFKFKLNADNLPLLAYIFRNTNDTIRWEIIEYIDSHIGDLGLTGTYTLDELYNEIRDTLPFIMEFIPITLMLENRLPEYCEKRSVPPAEAAIFLYIIIDNYDAYKKELGEDKLHSDAIYLFEWILKQNALEFASAICAKAKDLPYDFLRYVLIQGLLNDANDLEDDDEQLHLTDEFVYGIARLLITIDSSLALELVKNHARQGKYSDSTLKLYNALCHDFPEETADFDDTLHERAVYADFVTDSVFYKFASLQHASIEELADFFENYYVTEMDTRHYFMTKLLQHLNEKISVQGVETADYFLNRLASSVQNAPTNELFQFLIHYLSKIPAIDLFDFYHQNASSFRKVVSKIKSASIKRPINFTAAGILIDLNEALQVEDCNYDHLLSEIIKCSLYRYVDAETLTDEFGHLLFDKLFRISQKLSNKQLSCLTNKILISLARTEEGGAWIHAVWSKRITVSPDMLYPLTAHFLLAKETKHNALCKTLAEQLLNAIPSQNRKQVYRILISFASTPEEKASLKGILLKSYCQKISLFRKILTAPKKTLFKKL